VERVGPLGGLALVVRAAGQPITDMDALDDQDLVLHDYHAFSLCAQLALARIDPARLQRASKRSRESTGGSRHHIVERGGVLGILAEGGPIVLAHLVMGAEQDRVGSRREKGLANGSALPNDPNLGDVFGLVHN
jgi:hypothetical protein